jgi:hypothetical protein
MGMGVSLIMIDSMSHFAVAQGHCVIHQFFILTKAILITLYTIKKAKINNITGK